MKFDFQMQVKGMSKIANGQEKKFEGADINCSCEANVGEVVEFLKNSQLSLDKILTFINIDMPNAIRENGKACLDVVKEERILDQEYPHKSRKEMQEEINTLKKWNDDLHNELQQTESERMDEMLNKNAERQINSELKNKIVELEKQLEEKTLQFNSLQEDMEGTMVAFREMENDYNDLKARIEEKAKARKEWSETIA